MKRDSYNPMFLQIPDRTDYSAQPTAHPYKAAIGLGLASALPFLGMGGVAGILPGAIVGAATGLRTLGSENIYKNGYNAFTNSGNQVAANLPPEAAKAYLSYKNQEARDNYIKNVYPEIKNQYTINDINNNMGSSLNGSLSLYGDLDKSYDLAKNQQDVANGIYKEGTTQQYEKARFAKPSSPYQPVSLTELKNTPPAENWNYEKHLAPLQYGDNVQQTAPNQFSLGTAKQELPTLANATYSAPQPVKFGSSMPSVLMANPNRYTTASAEGYKNNPFFDQDAATKNNDRYLKNKEFPVLLAGKKLDNEGKVLDNTLKGIDVKYKPKQYEYNQNKPYFAPVKTDPLLPLKAKELQNKIDAYENQKTGTTTTITDAKGNIISQQTTRINRETPKSNNNSPTVEHFKELQQHPESFESFRKHFPNAVKRTKSGKTIIMIGSQAYEVSR